MLPPNLLPEGWRYCIAGGWAACPALATDRDVWVFSPSGDLAWDRQLLLDHLEIEGVEFTEEEETRDFLSDNYGDHTLTAKVAMVPAKSCPIHLLVTTAADAETVLASFDISTHQVAITDTGHVIRGPYWTPVTVRPEVIKEAPTTLARLAKITARYAQEAQ